MASYMSLLLLVLVTIVQASPVTRSSDDVTEGTELVFAFMIHRHGNRTPVTSSLSYVENKYDIDEIDALIAPWGLGQLTDVGKRSAYKTGEFIRRRYDGLLAPKYNKSEIYIRSTDSARTKMTVLTAMTAVYPAIGDTWSNDIKWVPIPYTTVPAKYDFNEALFNCPTLTTSFSAKSLATNTRMDAHADIIGKISEIIDYDITSNPVLVQSVYDVILSLISLGYDVGDDVTALLPELNEASGVAWDVLLGDNEDLPLAQGVLLNEFFTYANKVIAGTDTQKVRVYSAHDTNVYPFMAVSAIEPRQGVVKYAGLFSLELRRNIETGQYYVLPVYLQDSNNGEETYIAVKDCGVLCDYDTFYNVTSKYLLDEDSWRTKCGFSNDLDIDTSNID